MGWDVGGDFLRFRHRADPFIVIKLFRSWVFFLLQEDQLRVEQESTSGRSPVARLIVRM